MLLIQFTFIGLIDMENTSETPHKQDETLNKFKVTLHLMVDPTKGDETFNRKYIVNAKDENDAYREAEKKQSEDIEVRYRSVFNYTIVKLD